jgi:membrane protease YdiL (CAAX protease family)
MHTPIGSALISSPRLLWFTMLASILLVGADMATAGFGSYLRIDTDLRFTWAIIGCLICAFVAAQTSEGGITFGFQLAPCQGWNYWFKATIAVAAMLAVILLVAGLVFLTLGYRFPEPRLTTYSQMWPLFLWMCIASPILEEVLYRLVLCPPSAALLGARTCIVVNGSVFALLHFLYGNPSPENLLGGFILSWAFLKSGTLIIPITLHSVGNFCAFLANVGYFYWWHGRTI